MSRTEPRKRKAKSHSPKVVVASVSLWSATIESTRGLFAGLTFSKVSRVTTKQVAAAEEQIRERLHAFDTRVRVDTLARRLG